MFPFHFIDKIRINRPMAKTLYKLIYRGIFYHAFFLFACERSLKMEAMENVRSAHVFDLILLKELYSVFGIYYKIHSFREIFIG